MKSIKEKLKASKTDGFNNMRQLNSDELKQLIGGNASASAASGSTQTTSGSLCDGTAVCNCKCPAEKPQYS